jgi:flagellar protein FlaJ
MKAGLGNVMLVASVFLLLVGLVAMADDRKVAKRDSDIAAFLRSLGGVMQAIGATAAEAISRLDFRSLGVLKEDVSLLHDRLVAGITPSSCWRRFVGETGSELINRSVTTFWDGITLGGEPQEVGNQASAFALKISLLRAQRSQIASGFTWLTLAMHAVLITLSAFVYSVFLTFAKLVGGLTPKEGLNGSGLPNISSLGFFNPNAVHNNLLYFLMMTVIFVLTFANAFAIYAVSGGHPSKLIFYVALTGAISGAVITVVPPITHTLFHVT